MRTQTEALTNILKHDGRRESFYGHALSPETLILIEVFKYSPLKFSPVLSRFGVFVGFS